MKNKLTTLVLFAAIAYGGYKLYKKFIPPKMTFTNTELTLLSNNEKTSIEKLKGNVVLVSFFQSWCVDCAKETAILTDLATSINNPTLKILYISDEETSKIEGFKNRFASDNIIYSKSSTAFSSLGIAVYPTTYLINKKGETILAKLESYDWMNEKEKIKKLLIK
jgi:thiol-disulfide isomerase/thioredoxin